MEDLIRVVEEYTEMHSLLPRTKVFAGVSGGCDSMALLFVLNDIVKRKYPETDLAAVHVHHGIRGAEADADEELVRNFCEKLGVPFQSFRLDIPDLASENKRSLETEGRIRRYALFDELCGADGVVAVAHHMEDQAESIAMHLFRGCGMEGLVGMRPKSGNVIRPFLGLHKADIRAFCEAKSIPFHEDATNADSAYSRNFFRNEVFPLIDRGVNQSPVDALCGLGERVKDENDFLDDLAAKALAEIQRELSERCACGVTAAPSMAGETQRGPVPSVPAAAILAHPLKLRILKKLALQAWGDIVDIEACHWESILQMMAKNESNKRICLPGGRIARMEQGKVLLEREGEDLLSAGGGHMEGVGFLVRKEDGSQELPLSSIPCGKNVNFFQSFVRIRLDSIEKEAEVVYNDTTWFIPESVLGKAVLRTRKEGDSVCRAGTSLTKDLRRFMNDVHIPADVRDQLLLVAEEDRVLWVPGHLHAVGFIDAPSREKFFASAGRGDDRDPDGSDFQNDPSQKITPGREKLYRLVLFV